MSLPTRLVTELFELENGEPWAYAPVVIQLFEGTYSEGVSYPRQTMRFRADADGLFSTELTVTEGGELQAFYRVTYPNGETFDFTLLAGGDTTLSEQRILGTSPADPVYATLAAYVDTHLGGFPFSGVPANDMVPVYADGLVVWAEQSGAGGGGASDFADLTGSLAAGQVVNGSLPLAKLASAVYTSAQVDTNIGVVSAALTAHAALTNNPHTVTAAQVGLGSVENTALSTWAGSANVITLGAVTAGSVPPELIPAGTFPGAIYVFQGVTATSFTGPLVGNASTATVLATARAINGVVFNGSAAITVPAAADTLTGTALNATVVTSSLTAVGTLASGAVPVTLLTGTTLPASVVTSSLTTIGTLVAGTVPAARISNGSFGAGNYVVTGELTTTGLVGFGGATTADAQVNITAALNLQAIRVVGYSLTGSDQSPALNIAGEWSTTGTPTGIQLNLTNTASGSGSLLMALQTGGANRFTVQWDGFTRQTADSNVTNLTSAVGSELALRNLNTTVGNFSALTFQNSGSNTVARIIAVNIAHATNASDLVFLTRPASGALTERARITGAGALSISNTLNAVTPTLPNRTITMVVGGTTVYLHAKTTND